MRFDPPLETATLLRRYKRFVVDVRLTDGSLSVAHTNNTGRMTGCCTPGASVLLSRAPEGNKLPWRLRAVRVGRAWVCVDTQLPNALVADALRRRRIPELAGYDQVATEVRVGSSRFDVALGDSSGALGPAWVEVKNVTLREDAFALFPDAPSERGRKHLTELIRLAADGARCVLIPFVGRADVAAFDAAAHVDPAWAVLLDEAAAGGVEILPWQARIGRREAALRRPLPWRRRAR